ncbi:methyltransferase domain-containing protein [uncultured Propionivibrio sp.]|uniref:methyltransferase domain-containing protein n=1 Tax=uncultured Propionivibrio sp. TaxID=426737 RepID=UPI0029C0B9EA|nr:methyltransferase domain-containing protein [uncultured Propionivibrio sp.]
MSTNTALTHEARNQALWRQELRQRFQHDPHHSVIVYLGRWSAELSDIATYFRAHGLLVQIIAAARNNGKDILHIIADIGGNPDHPPGLLAPGATEHLPAGLAYAALPIEAERTEDDLDSKAVRPFLLGADLVIAAKATASPTEDAPFVAFCPERFPAWGVLSCPRADIVDTLRLFFAAETLATPDLGAQTPPLSPGEQISQFFKELMSRVAFAATPPIASGQAQPSCPPVWKTALGVETAEATGYHAGERTELIDLSPRPIRCALDIGCAAGGTGAYIKQKYPQARVVGVELNKAAADMARTRLDAVLVGKFEEVDLTMAGLVPGEVDTVILADVLEHLYDPWSALTRLLPWLSADGQILASIPNVRNLKLMESLAGGYWRYESAGLLDITHIRFFTLRELRRFFHETGYHVQTLRYAIDPRLLKFHREHQGPATPIDIHLGNLSLRGIGAEELDELCSLQFHVRAGINARADEIEHYQQRPAHRRLLDALAPTAIERQLWKTYLHSQEAPATVELFLLDMSGDIDAVSVTIAGLGDQDRPPQITVLSVSPLPEGLTLPDTLRWHHLTLGESHFAALNQRLAVSNSTWCGILYTGDSLEAYAVQKMVERGRHSAGICCIYGDDTVKTQDQPGLPYLKTDFDLLLLLGTDYLGCGLTLFRTEWLRTHNGFAVDRRGAEILDAALRLYAESGTDGFAHLAEPILHRPVGGNDGDLPFGQVIQARRQAIADFLTASGLPGRTEEGWAPGTLRVRGLAPEPSPPVSLLIVADAHNVLLPKHLETLLEKTDYPNYQVLILDNGVTDTATRAFLNEIDAMGSPILQVFRIDTPEPPALALTMLAGQASGAILVAFSLDLLPASPDWLSELVALQAMPGVGAVSPRILDNTGTVRHSGLIAGPDRSCIDAFAGLRHDNAGIFGRAHLVQRFSALPDACLLIRRELFEAAGGLDTADGLTRTQAVTDLCLRLSEAGLTCAWTPFVSLVCAAPAPHQEQPEAFPDPLIERHLALLGRDPAYHPAFALVSPAFSYEPRLELVSDRLPWHPLPRILAFNADRGGCGHYRILDPARALDATGRAQALCSDQMFDAIEVARVTPDVLVAQRQVTDPQLERIERIRNINRIPLIYELDDLITDLQPDSPHRTEMPEGIAMRLQRGIALADRLIVSTEPLAEALRHLNPELRVVPNRLSRQRWEGLTLPERRERRKPRVGWSGSISHAGDLRLIEAVVRELADEVDWVFMALAPSAIKPFIAEYHPGRPFAAYPQALADLDLDLALAPLEPCRFNECKSNLKLLEYGALGYPVIATNITPYQCALPVTLVHNTTAAWIRTIREQLADRNALVRQGEALRAAIQRDWMLEDHLDDWLDAWTA